MNNEISFIVRGDVADLNTEKLARMLKLISGDANLRLEKKKSCLKGTGLTYSGCAKLQVSLKTLAYDLDAENFRIVITPYFHENLPEICPEKGIGITSISEEIIPALKNGKDLSFLKESIRNVPQEILETVLNYIRYNQSVQLVSEMMFTHRNTVNYRINKFITLTGINIHDPINCNFVYSVVKLTQSV